MHRTPLAPVWPMALLLGAAAAGCTIGPGLAAPPPLDAPSVDAGTPLDAPSVDAGTPLDAPSVDAGTPAGEGEGEGEGAALVDDSPLSARSVDEVCAQWRAFQPFSGTEWTPVGDGSDTCDPGTLADDAQRAAVSRVSLYRWLAGLPPVDLAPQLVAQEQACAVVEDGIGALNHFPSSDAPCFTQAGAQGAGSSNLAQGTDTVGSVDLFVSDDGVLELGHRRWVLNPTAAVTAFGHKGAFTCMYSFSEEAAADPDFLTWPPAGPVPVDAAAGRFWFGTNHHDLSAAVVEVSVDGGAFTAVSFDILPYGYGTLATNIAFDVPGLSPWELARDGRVVTVRLSGLDGGAGTLTWSTRFVACE